MDTHKHILKKKEDAHFEPLLLKRIKEYVHNNLASDLRSFTVAAEFSISVSTLQNIFRKHLNQTYGQYVTNVRMQSAFKIIDEEDRVKEAMYATGYKVKSTFYRAFKKAFGHPPGHLRD